eukprot:513745_1
MDEYESKLYEKDAEIGRLNDKIEELLNELEYTKGINNEVYINRSPQSRKYSSCSSIPYSVLDHDHLDDISVISDVYDVYDVDHVYQTDNELCHKGVNTEISHLMTVQKLSPLKIHNLSIKERIYSKLFYSNCLIYLLV